MDNEFKDMFSGAKALYPMDRGGLLGTQVTQPTNPEPSDVNIRKVFNGFIVTIGCKTFVTKEWAELQSEVGLYLANPKKATEKWLS